MRPSAHELAALILLAASATGCAASAPPREPRLPMCAGEPAPNSGDWLKRTDDPAARRRAFATGEPVVNGRCTVPPALIQRALRVLAATDAALKGAKRGDERVMEECLIALCGAAGMGEAAAR